MAANHPSALVIAEAAITNHGTHTGAGIERSIAHLWDINPAEDVTKLVGQVTTTSNDPVELVRILNGHTPNGHDYRFQVIAPEAYDAALIVASALRRHWNTWSWVPFMTRGRTWRRRSSELHGHAVVIAAAWGLTDPTPVADLIMELESAHGGLGSMNSPASHHLGLDLEALAITHGVA